MSIVSDKVQHGIELRRCGISSSSEGLISRVPIEHAGWKSVRYLGRRYQLFGGIRTAWFIDLNSPILTRKEISKCKVI